MELVLRGYFLSLKFPSMTKLIIYMSLCLNFAANAEVCESGRHWVKEHFRKAYVKGDGTLVKASMVTAHCRTSGVDHDYWAQIIKNGIPENWPHKTEVVRPWNVEDTERVFEAIQEIPDALKTKKISGIYRLKRSKFFPNPATFSRGTIVLYDSAFLGTTKDRSLARFLAHEFAHQIYLNLTDQERNHYNLTTNWVSAKNFKTGQMQSFSRTDGFVRNDGRESPEEDFANNLEFYLFEPMVLKSKTPHAFRWIQEHFGDNFRNKGKSHD